MLACKPCSFWPRIMRASRYSWFRQSLMQKATRAIHFPKQYRHSRETAAIRIILAILYLLLSACTTSYSRIANTEAQGPLSAPIEAPSNPAIAQRSSDILLFVAFSGGGTRAAAFSYGVLEELRDTRIHRDGKDIRLLDEIDAISSVSGGSFTAAYYCLFGDRIFEDYEELFLKRNVQKSLVHSMLNPTNWFRLLASGFDRTELAVDYYDRNIFRGRTFGDLLASPGPRLASTPPISASANALLLPPNGSDCCAPISPNSG